MEAQNSHINLFKTELNRVPIEWDLYGGTFTFFDIDACLFWVSPSLKNMIAPLAEELGKDLFQMLVAHSSSLGTEEDYHAMVTFFSDNFHDGFLEWGKAVGVCGWGRFEINEFDPIKKEAIVTVYNCWELIIHKELADKAWGCPFIQGKIIGIFNKGFDTNIWADTIEVNVSDPKNKYIKFKLFPSEKTIEKEINSIRIQQTKKKEKKLLTIVENKTLELEQAKITLHQQNADLESIVKNRTLELNKLIKDLNSSNLELETAQAKLISHNEELMKTTEQLLEAQRNLNISHENLLKAKEKAEEASELKSRFLSNMSHEMRTPLNAIIGFSDLMLNHELDEATSQSNLESINYSAKHLFSIIRDILDVSKMDNESIYLEEKNFDIQHLLKKLHSNASLDVESKDLKIDLNIDPNIPKLVFGDQGKINQILINLVSNAIKFTEKGFVIIRVKNAFHSEKVALHFEIEDTGFGIPEDKLDLIFEKFYRLENLYSIGGTGLGLNIAQSLVRLMGGEIKVQSTYGKGSIFSFDLFLKQAPLEIVHIQESIASVVEKIQEKNLRVLCVEDNEMNQMLNTQLLKPIVKELVLSENGLEALKVLETKDFDIILTDIQMDYMSGNEFIIEMHRRNIFIPTIIITANVSDEFQSKLNELNPLGFLTKPIDRMKLYELLLSV